MFRDTSMIQDNNLIGIDNRREAMCDHNDRKLASRTQVDHDIAKIRLSLRIHGAGRLVQNENWCGAHQRARYIQPLTLAGDVVADEFPAAAEC